MRLTASTGRPPRTLMMTCRQFLADESGGSLPLAAVMLLVLMGFIGMATDTSRGYLVKNRLADALDAAALAAAHELGRSDFDSYVRMYFNANFPPGYMGAAVTLLPPQISDDQETVTLSATAKMDTTFMKLFGHNDLEVASVSEVTRRTSSLDLAIAIDMSGSMNNPAGGGQSRIQAARQAAITLVNIVFGNKATKDLLKVGLVPWNGKVNIIENGNPNDAGAVTEDPVPNYVNPAIGAGNSVFFSSNSPSVPLMRTPPSRWRGCVFARYLNGQPDDDADDAAGPVTLPGGFDWPGWEPIQELPFGGTPCLRHGITRLTNQKQTIIDAINELTWPQGNTSIAQGLSWAWRVVSPGPPFDDSDAFVTGNHTRAIILLTDGEQSGRANAAYNAQFGLGNAAGPAGMDARLLRIANTIKNEGVKIYAIQYAYDSGPLRALIEQMATEPNAPYYYFAPDAATLQMAFREIADDLSELRISR